MWWIVTRSLPVESVSLLPISIVLSWLRNWLRSTVTRSEPLVMSNAPSWTWYLRPKCVASVLSKVGASVNVLWSAQTLVGAAQRDGVVVGVPLAGRAVGRVPLREAVLGVREGEVAHDDVLHVLDQDTAAEDLRPWCRGRPRWWCWTAP